MTLMLIHQCIKIEISIKKEDQEYLMIDHSCMVDFQNYSLSGWLLCSFGVDGLYGIDMLWLFIIKRGPLKDIEKLYHSCKLWRMSTMLPWQSVIIWYSKLYVIAQIHLNSNSLELDLIKMIISLQQFKDLLWDMVMMEDLEQVDTGISNHKEDQKMRMALLDSKSNLTTDRLTFYSIFFI